MKDMKIDTKIIKTLLTAAVLLLGAMPVFIPTVQASPDVSTEKWYFKIRDYAPSEYWAYNSSFRGLVMPVSANIDDDPQLEVIVSAGYRTDDANRWGVIVCVDGDTGVGEWNYSGENIGGHACVELGDLDSDGDLEAVITGYDSIVALHVEDGSVLWGPFASILGRRFDHPAIIANIDGTVFVYHCSGWSEGTYKRWGTNGTVHTWLDTGSVYPCNGGLAAADINQDGKIEIIQPGRSINGHAGHRGLQCFDEDLNYLWNQTDFGCSGGTPVIYDVDGDGYLDVIHVSSSSGNAGIAVIDGSTMDKMTGKYSTDLDLYGHDGPTVYDVDGDGDVELFTTLEDSTHVYVWDLTNWQLETTLLVNNSYNQAPVIANVCGDSSLEIVAGSSDGLYIFDGSDYSLISRDQHGWGPTWYNSFVAWMIGDVDDDGFNEIVSYGARNTVSGMVMCFDTSGATQGARSVNMYYSERRNSVEEYVEGLLEEPGPETEGVGRIISATHDDIYTFIRNSNGKYWDAKADNIQVAIDDLVLGDGTVWLPGLKSFNLSSTIILKEDVTLDMGGSSFYMTSNINVVDMRDGSTIKNGCVDVSDVSDFDKAAIVINAFNYIDSGVGIYDMNLESKGPLDVPNSFGRGTAIYLHATDTNVPQKICNVRCKGLYTRDFYYGVRIHNERDPDGGEYGAIINGNSFTDMVSYADSYYIHISRDTDADLDNCNTSGNYFSNVQYQSGGSGWYGGEHFTWTIITTDGYGNSFTNIMIWDWHHAEGDHAVVLTSDSSHCYVMARGGPSTWINNGAGNTIFDTGSGVLTVDSVVEGE